MFRELVETRAFQRLKFIRFLGGIDYVLVRSPNGSRGSIRYTRYQHSLGVSRLALLYADLRALPLAHRRLVLAAALLHDIGHSPLSHSLEPVFQEIFGLEHHRATADIIAGRVQLGREIYKTLRRHNVNVERLLATIAGQDSDYDGFFSGPINFDTIEGILRTIACLKSSQNGLRPDVVTEAALWRSSETHREIVDDFWFHKDYVYRNIINSKVGILADFTCQLFMRRHISSMSSVDYFTTESQLFRKMPGLRELLTSRSFETEVLREVDEPIRYRARRFVVHPEVDFFARDDKGRYRQTSEVRVLSPRCAGGREEPTQDLFNDSGNRSGKAVL